MANETEPRKSMSTRGLIGGILVVGAIGAGTAFTVQALADSRSFQHVAAEARYHTNLHFVARKGFSELTEAELQTRITRVVRHVAIEIDATEEQQQKIVALVTAVARDMQPIRANFMANRDQMRTLLLAETVDRAAMERMRSERMAEIDQASQAMITALADVAEVLTPEQRRTLDARIQEFRDNFGGRRGRWRQ